MAQFTKYSYLDPSGPGVIYGAAGDLLRVLDLCLVTGYTGKSAAGWTKPIANSGNTGCYKSGGGSQMTLYINDNGPNVTSTTKEAWMVGWENLTAITAPVGVGTGQFPTPNQVLTTGHLVIRKSALADGTTGRTWFLFADAYTFYLFINAGDPTSAYYGTYFGDIYSYKGSTDLYRCLIVAGVTENQSQLGSTANAACDLGQLGGTTPNHPGHYMARGFGGLGFAIQVSKIGDLSKCGISGVPYPITGDVPYPNGPDGAVFMRQLEIAENTSSCIRGKMRGMYQLCHASSNFSDGQVLTNGGGDLAGKTFYLVKRGSTSNGANQGVMAIEISNTLDTN